jgi:DUF4097 and DUF4098 domain-containing protein YvlB
MKGVSFMRGTILILILTLTLVLAAGCVDQVGDILHREEAVQVFEDNIEVTMFSLDFQTYNGDIEVNLWDKSSYRVEVVKWAGGSSSEEAQRRVEALQVAVSVSTDEPPTLSVDVPFGNHTGADITAYVPAVPFVTVSLATINGHIAVSDMTAETAFLETTNGSIDLTCQGGDYTLRTTNGNVTVNTGDKGEFDLTTSNGRIEVTTQGPFEFDLETSIGFITVEADTVTYTTDSTYRKKGYTSPDPTIIIRASATNGYIEMTQE